MAEPSDIRVGVAGWTYAPWRGVFYPSGLAQREELAWAARALNSIEINGTFYRLQQLESFVRWHDETPDDFVFSVKGPRFITHIRRLVDVELPLANFLATGVLRLGAKLGPLLWQFPPSMSFDAELFEAFLALLPGDTESACRLASRHEARVAGGDAIRVDAHRTLRHAVEVRNQSFRTPAFVELLRRHGVAAVCADSLRWPRFMDVTADFVYCRLHGPETLYPDGYDDAALDAWAARVSAWARGEEPADAERLLPAEDSGAKRRDVFVYFDNDAKVRAPGNALSFARRLGVARVDSARSEAQGAGQGAAPGRPAPAGAAAKTATARPSRRR